MIAIHEPIVAGDFGNVTEHEQRDDDPERVGTRLALVAVERPLNLEPAHVIGAR